MVLMLLFQGFVFAQNNKDKPEIIDGSVNNEWAAMLKEKVWKYNPDDRPEYAKTDFDDSSWKYLSDEESDTLPKIYWLRYYFKLTPSMASKPITLEVNQNGASEIYLDGKKFETLGKVDSMKPVYQIRKIVPKIITISDTLTHVVAVRFQEVNNDEKSSFVNFGSGFSMFFNDANERVAEKMKQNKSFFSFTMLISGIFLALGFIHLLLFLFYRKAIYNLYFGIYNLSIAVMSYLVGLFYQIEDPNKVEDYVFWFYVSFIAFCFSLTAFVNSLFGKKIRRFYISSIFPVIGIICLLVFKETNWSGVILISYMVFVGFESFILIVRAMLRKEKSAFIVGGGILVFFSVIVIFIIGIILGGGNYSVQSGFLGVNFKYVLFLILFSFPISISAYLGWQFAATNTGLTKQLVEVNRLSDLTIQQEQEKQSILQNQNEILERKVEDRTAELRLERQKSENLLLNILPQEVAEELKEKGSSKAHYYDEVSVLFTDFVSFTRKSEEIGPEAMLKELNECFTAFDMIMEKHNLEKIKTIGDAYLSVSGLPQEDPRHAQNAILAAIDILNFIENRKKESQHALDIRIGINSGSLIAGIIGVKKFAYDIWGDTVNTAARMEQAGEKGKINISKNTYELVKDDFQTIYRGKISVKGKGEQEMYFVEA